MTIVNGNFENGLTGWTVYSESGSEVLLKNNTLIIDGQPGPGVDGYAARLYVYKCSNARISQDILIDKSYILFDYVTYTIDRPENVGVRIKQGTTILYSEGIPIGGYYNSAKAHAINVSAYLNQTVTLEFYIEASSRCYYGDHGNNWLWIDNVILADNTTQGILNVSVLPDISSAWWTPGDIYINGILQGTGFVSKLVDAGQYNVSFGNVRLYTTPIPQTVTINAGQTINITSIYSLSKGILEISTIPVFGDIYVDGNLVGNGSVSIDINGGQHTVSYGNVSGYATPSNFIVDVILGNQVVIIGTYAALIAVITATNIAVSPGPYIQPSTIIATIIWQNTGTLQGSFDPAIIITKSSNGTTTHMNIGNMIILDPAQSTAQISFTVPDLVKDIYTICPDPN